jgi:hypothetical protein
MKIIIRSLHNLLAAFLSMLFGATCVNAATISLTAIDQGWYTDTGWSIPDNPNYLAGFVLPVPTDPNSPSGEFRNWFVFDLSAISGNISSATLRAYNIDSPPAFLPGYDSADPTETWTLFDVSTEITSLSNGTGGVAAFNDLGSGLIYGSKSVSSADNGRFVEVLLNSDAIGQINNSSSLFAIGGALTTLSGDRDESIFGFSQEDPRVELVVTTVPLPSALILFISGAALTGYLAKNRRSAIGRRGTSIRNK